MLLSIKTESIYAEINILLVSIGDIFSYLGVLSVYINTVARHGALLLKLVAVAHACLAVIMLLRVAVAAALMRFHYVQSCLELLIGSQVAVVGICLIQIAAGYDLHAVAGCEI